MPFDNPHQTPFGDAELLWDARGRISSRGRWAQGRFQDGDRYCLVAALSVAADSPTFHMPNRVERRLARLLVSRLPPEVPFWGRMRIFTARQRLMWFNDSPRTCHEDVMALFDRALDHVAINVSAYVPA